MRAFLSTGAGHHPVDGSRYTCGFNVESALSEAHAILAETEPTFMFAEHSRIRPLYLSGGDNYLLRAALAESLRSFVEA